MWWTIKASDNLIGELSEFDDEEAIHVVDMRIEPPGHSHPRVEPLALVSITCIVILIETMNITYALGH